MCRKLANKKVNLRYFLDEEVVDIVFRQTFVNFVFRRYRALLVPEVLQCFTLSYRRKKGVGVDVSVGMVWFFCSLTEQIILERTQQRPTGVDSCKFGRYNDATSLASCTTCFLLN